MKKVLPYILIIVVILIAGGIYIQFSDKGMENMQNLFSGTEKKDTKTEFQNLGPAPEFSGITKWLNSDALSIKDLKGKVVLVDFWTYSCINCIRTMPYITKWYDTYKDAGLVVIGVHTPEFDFEKDAGNVQTAMKRYGINYPVALDNNYSTWNVYSNRYWPAKYLIDKNGDIVYTHFGEGDYDITESMIQKLLGVDAKLTSDKGPDLSKIGSPEMYFGLNRLEFISNTERAVAGPINYRLPSEVPLNTFALEGNWKLENEKAVISKGDGKIKLHFKSGKVFMVADNAVKNKKSLVEVRVDGKYIATVAVDESKNYPLFDSNDYKEHTLELYIDSPGFEVFTFTFG